MARRKKMAKQRKKMSSKKSKPIGITKIPKGNDRKLKPGVALVYGTRANPRFGSKRFKSTSKARDYAVKEGLV